MSECEGEQTEEAEEKESIENLWRLSGMDTAELPESFVSVIKGQQRLDYPCHPEKSHEPSDEHEHLKGADFSAGEVAFCKYNTDYQEDDRFHQLKKLEA